MTNKFIEFILIFVCIILLQNIFSSYKLYSQKETYNWIFGDSAAITFLPEGKSATAIKDGGFIRQMEGSATISDKNGNLLLYSDGVNILNRNHRYVSYGGGLKGNYSSSRSVIIIPRPYSNQIYYVFTIDAFERSELVNNVWSNKNGLRYSIVDVLGDNQNGEVDVNNKNVLLLEDAVEKMITINHSNKNDVWLVAFNWKDNCFYSYLITKDGISAPFKTLRPFEAMKDPKGSLFNLEYDIDSKRLISCDGQTNSFVIYNFDPSNGNINVSNPIVIPAFADTIVDSETQKMFVPYSAAFSKDGKKFYATCYQRSLLQFDFSFTELKDVLASRKIIADSSTVGIENYNFGALRRGPDDRIYVARDKYDYLGVIDKPNLAGTKCQFVSHGVYLEGKKSRYGLPIMMNYSKPPCDFSNYAGDNKTICFGTETVLGSTSVDVDNMKFEWTPDTYLSNSNVLNPICNAPQTTQYVLKITNELLGCFDYDTITVTVLPLPQIIKSNDVTVCKNISVTIGNAFNSDELKYEWTPKTYLDNPYSKTATCTPDTNMQYILTITDKNTGCINFDTVNVRVVTIDNIEILGSDFICEGVTTTLTLAKDYSSYLWSTGEKTKSITVDKEGVYSVTVTDELGCKGTKSIKVKYLASDNFNIIAPKKICLGTPTIIKTDGNFVKYLWSTGDTTPTVTISTGGTYWVNVENELGCKASDTIIIYETEIAYNIPVSIDFGNICPGQSAEISRNIANVGKEEFTISNVEIVHSKDIFIVEQCVYPIIVNLNSEKQIKISFKPEILENYADTLLIYISAPCEAVLRIPIKGTSVKNHFTVKSQDFKIEPGNEIQIPIKIDYTTNKNKVNPTFEFTFDISYDKYILRVYSLDYGEIISRTVNNDIETVKIKAIFPANSDKLNILCNAETTLGSKIVSEFTINNLVASLDCFESDSSKHTVELVGCAIKLRALKFFNPTTIDVNAVENFISCNILSEEDGQFILTLYNAQGIEVSQKSWEKSDFKFSQKEVLFDDKKYASGLYLVALQTKYYWLTKKIMLIK